MGLLLIKFSQRPIPLSHNFNRWWNMRVTYRHCWWEKLSLKLQRIWIHIATVFLLVLLLEFARAFFSLFFGLFIYLFLFFFFFLPVKVLLSPFETQVERSNCMVAYNADSFPCPFSLFTGLTFPQWFLSGCFLWLLLAGIQCFSSRLNVIQVVNFLPLFILQLWKPESIW